jgi:biotin transport system substrate-specific component
MANLKDKKLYRLVLVAMFAAVITICSWISIPTTIPFTLQTMGVFIAAGLLGWKYGTLSVVIYVLLGAVGVPVFAGFSGGVGTLVGPTGGYILGFIFTALAVGLITKFFGTKLYVLIIAMVVGLALCYLFGTIWFMIVYQCDFVSALVMCVIPYLIFDGCKILVASILVNRLAKYV